MRTASRLNSSLARFEGGCQFVLDIGVEAGAFHRAVQNPRGNQAVMDKARDKGLGVPMTEGGVIDQARTDRGQPVVLTRLVLSEISSIKISICNLLAMSVWRPSIQFLRLSATSGRNCSLASSVFFMAEAMPVQPFAHRTAMHANAMNRGHFRDDLVQRQIALGCKPIHNPSAIPFQLALGMIALALRQRPTTFAFQKHHIVHRTRRNPKVTRGLPMPVPLLDECNDATAKFHRMCSARSAPYIWQIKRIANQRIWES